jgi:hypothetical protein
VSPSAGSEESTGAYSNLSCGLICSQLSPLSDSRKAFRSAFAGASRKNGAIRESRCCPLSAKLQHVVERFESAVVHVHAVCLTPRGAGTLNLPSSWIFFVNSARPRSGGVCCGLMPRLANLSLVRLNPLWHSEHSPERSKICRPRFAARLSAYLSPFR